MEKIIWTSATRTGPERQQQAICLAQWAKVNPHWEIRALDLALADRYTTVFDHFDLGRQSITPAQFDLILMAFVLREHGGVWLSPLHLCDGPLDGLHEKAKDGVYGVGRGGIDPAVLAGVPTSRVIQHLHAAIIDHWADRTKEADPDWFSTLFDTLRTTYPEVDASWAAAALDAAPVFPIKDQTAQDFDVEPHPLPELMPTGGDRRFAQIRVGTENLGDHIQIIAGNRLMQRAGLTDPLELDRDDQLESAPALEREGVRREILMNGWFKNNKAEWPPHPLLDPIFVGFHIRPKICPALVSPRAAEYYKTQAPIGCRDEFTRQQIAALGVECWASHCPTLTLPRRKHDPQNQTKIYAVSRDGELGHRLPAHLGEITHISHYSGSTNHHQNMEAAADLLRTYAANAKLIVTSLLHCAMPAIAMGIPVVMLFPPNKGGRHASDRQRFSSLMQLITIHSEDDMDRIDWAGETPDITRVRLGIMDAIYDRHDRYHRMSRPLSGTLA